MKNVLIEVIGTQHIDNQHDKTELTTLGTMTETDNEYIIEYCEEQEPPMSAINVCVKIGKDEQTVEMTRSGPFNSCLNIEKSKRNLCRYGTEYGDILMGISGKSIENNCDEGKGQFLFSYDIDINGLLASKNEVTLKFRENQG